MPTDSLACHFFSGSQSGPLQYLYRKPYEPISWFLCQCSILVELNLVMLVFVGGKRKNQEINPLNKARTN